MRDAVPVNVLVDGPFLVQDVRGFPAVKVKVRDAAGVALVRAVRDAVGPAVGVRVDANGAWDVDTAVTMITRLAAFDLEYVEQPVATLADLAAVRRKVDVPIAADECIRTLDDARELHRRRRRRRHRDQATATRWRARRASQWRNSRVSLRS